MVTDPKPVKTLSTTLFAESTPTGRDFKSRILFAGLDKSPFAVLALQHFSTFAVGGLALEATLASLVMIVIPLPPKASGEFTQK